MSDRERFVVTGMGVVSALGCGVDPFFERLLAGESGIVRLEGLDPPGLEQPIGGTIPAWHPEEWLSRSLARATWRITHYAYAAARQAFDSAGLQPRDRPEGGIVIGTGFAAQGSSEETYRRCFSHPGTRPRPTAITQGMANATAGLLASEFNLLGPNLTILAACASSNHAIGQALDLIRSGRTELVLAGGADAPLTPIVMAAWAALRVLAPGCGDPVRACRPFGRDRAGLVVGEGAAFLVLESLSSASARGARIFAEIAGYGATADGGHITHPDVAGVRRSMLLALQDARVAPALVDFVSSHGTGTVANDSIESQALWDVLGSGARHVPVNSTKAAHGHAMGASGALEAVAAIASMRRRVVPPTLNLDDVDPLLPPLDFVRGAAREHAPSVVLSNSFGFGGTNAVLVLRRFE
jgi:3-oxoacyl-[acyl-carrier-protein] synthase II